MSAGCELKVFPCIGGDVTNVGGALKSVCCVHSALDKCLYSNWRMCTHPPVPALCFSGPSVLGYWLAVIKGWRFPFSFSVMVKCWPCLWFPFPFFTGWNSKEFLQVSPFSPSDRNNCKSNVLFLFFFLLQILYGGFSLPPLFPQNWLQLMRSSKFFLLAQVTKWEITATFSPILQMLFDGRKNKWQLSSTYRREGQSTNCVCVRVS